MICADRIEAFLREIVPDFKGVPLYVIDADDVPPGVLAVSATGCYGPRLDLQLRSWLDARDRWQGRGQAMIIRDSWGATVLGTALHEAAHALEQPFDLIEPQDFRELEELAAELTDLADRPTDDLEAIRDSGAPEWLCHDLGFIRLCLFLRRRAADCGCPVSADIVLGGYRYDVSPWDEYEAALESEFAATPPDATFATIRDTKPPAKFSELWCRDIRAWLDKQQCPSRCAEWIVAAQFAKFSPDDPFLKDYLRTKMKRG